MFSTSDTLVHWFAKLYARNLQHTGSLVRRTLGLDRFNNDSSSSSSLKPLLYRTVVKLSRTVTHALPSYYCCRRSTSEPRSCFTSIALSLYELESSLEVSEAESSIGSLSLRTILFEVPLTICSTTSAVSLSATFAVSVVIAVSLTIHSDVASLASINGVEDGVVLQGSVGTSSSSNLIRSYK